MRRLLLALALLGGSTVLILSGPRASVRAQTRPNPNDVGPGDGDAVLKLPFDSTPARPAPKQPVPQFEQQTNPRPTTPPPGSQPSSYNEIFGGKTPTGLPTVIPERDPVNLAVDDRPDINKDIAIQPAVGAWVIFIESYHGENAPKFARQMVAELREAYKLPAYTFNFGAEERRKENERVKGIIDKQKNYLRANNLPADTPIRVRVMRIEEQVGVVVGGYPTDEAAKKALDQIRKLKPPDPNKVELAKKFYVKEDAKKGNQGELAFVNPFLRSFIGRNPTVKHEQRPADWDNLDLAALKRLNSEETFSLLTCKKPITLAIKQFNTPGSLQSDKKGGGLLETMIKGKDADRGDAAALSARNLTEALRKSKLEAYVLHTKFSSVVTVGGFDSLEDPNLRAMQNLLESRLKLDSVGLFPKPLPMKVPR